MSIAPAMSIPATVSNVLSLWAVLLVLVLTGCSELRARHLARSGNEHFRAGDYHAAVRDYQQAERLAPHLPVIVLNKGLACRQLMVPGAKDARTEGAARCAVEAFTRLRELAPADARGEQLYVQTLFDADRYDELATLYQKQLDTRPDDALALNGMVQVYTRAQRPEEALRWTVERAERKPKDAEAQYAVGVFIFSQLMERGGGADKASYDPRGASDAGSAAAERPLFGVDDISGPKRVALANQGIAYLERALALRPAYREALVYANLLYRQKSFAFFDRPSDWQAAVEQAESYRNRALALDSKAHAAVR
jgi:tetratricopeptide (TPR) repeat protein